MAVRLVRAAGWLLIAAGLLVVLYLAYSLLFTNVPAGRAQNALQQEWELAIGPVGGRGGDTAGQHEQIRAVAGIDTGRALAVLQFRRPGSAEIPVHAEPLFVVHGVSTRDLQQGPGHYPSTALPGEQGNFAVAGHRTTYGAPFFNLDDLRSRDQVFVTDRRGRRFEYSVTEVRVVGPDETSVLGPDPLKSGLPTLTLTTCHPRLSNAHRLIVVAELVS